ncbi:unnamed protein product [Protopolystoma xenopodis]|uniref:Uncharacterized protein n=1 Tax=Protopolystoma xenopodis TaxID=117903 RepID=A0A448XLH8_9PLAT|nr:unnamed protein product [Protopolystoma xenopodis]
MLLQNSSEITSHTGLNHGRQTSSLQNVVDRPKVGTIIRGPSHETLITDGSDSVFETADSRVVRSRQGSPMHTLTSPVPSADSQASCLYERDSGGSPVSGRLSRPGLGAGKLLRQRLDSGDTGSMLSVSQTWRTSSRTFDNTVVSELKTTLKSIEPRPDSCQVVASNRFLAIGQKTGHITPLQDKTPSTVNGTSDSQSDAQISLIRKPAESTSHCVISTSPDSVYTLDSEVSFVSPKTSVVSHAGDALSEASIISKPRSVSSLVDVPLASSVSPLDESATILPSSSRLPCFQPLTSIAPQKSPHNKAHSINNEDIGDKQNICAKSVDAQFDPLDDHPASADSLFSLNSTFETQSANLSGIHPGDLGKSRLGVRPKQSQLSQSLGSLRRVLVTGTRRPQMGQQESISRGGSSMSIYSETQESYNCGIVITGDICFVPTYDLKMGCLRVFVKQARNIAVADIKRGTSDP